MHRERVPQLARTEYGDGLITSLPFAARSRRAAGAGWPDGEEDQDAGAARRQHHGVGCAPTATPPAAVRQSQRRSRVRRSVSNQTVTRNREAAIAVAAGAEHAEHASGDRDALAAVKSQPDGIDVSDDGCRSGQSHKGRAAAIACARRTAAAPLATSSIRTTTPRPVPVVRSTFAAPTFPLPARRTSDPRLPGQQEREWDGTREVADEDRKHQVSLQW